MNRSTMIIAILMLGIGLGGGYWLSQSTVEPSAITKQEPAKPLFYRNPMDPTVTSPVPAKDHMGMDYVPVYADEAQGKEQAGTVKIDPVVVQNIGVRTATAQHSSLSRTIRAVGRVAFDEQRMTRLHPKVEGWIEEIWVDKTGQQVKEDDILLSIYSPKLVSTQQEYLLALNNLSALKDSPFAEIKRGAEALVKSSRERLEMLDVAPHQIHELEQQKEIKKDLHIHAPSKGTVIRIGARQGQHVTPKTELYMLVDLSRVWVFADVYEYELPWVKVGDPVEMTLTAVPGRTFQGKLDYIYPYAETQTRTTRVRLVFDNPELLLRPDMFADLVIRSDMQEEAVVIPSEAVVRSGSMNRVFVVTAPGKFEPRPVKLGLESEGRVVVLEGVTAGEELVTSAQFLLDSESKLREAAGKMTDRGARAVDEPPTGEQTPEHDHDMNMNMKSMPTMLQHKMEMPADHNPHEVHNMEHPQEQMPHQGEHHHD